jgi:hypothetical protein
MVKSVMWKNIFNNFFCVIKIKYIMSEWVIVV